MTMSYPTIPIRLVDPPRHLAGHGYVLPAVDGLPPTTIRERGTRTTWAWTGWSGPVSDVAVYSRAA